MSTSSRRLVMIGQALALAAFFSTTGCGGGDSRVNSDPGAGRPSRADGGENTMRPDPNQASPSTSGTDPATGTDSTGRPSGPSGGTTGAGAGSGTSDTASGPQGASSDRK